ncbi:MAG: hypothetical protein H0W83_00935 [Planctomycetes bacterium]|nr:hypothetical protein [Planctomycetota bacterium]
MSDLLGDGLAWLERQRTAFLTKSVTYRRGPREVAVRATVSRTVFEAVIAGGVVERVESRDFLIAAAELGDLGLPQRGDLVVETGDGRAHHHEVLAPGREPHWRWSDPHRRVLRIHTKHLRTETIP